MPPRETRKKAAVKYAESSQSNADGSDSQDASVKSDASDDDAESLDPSSAESATSDSPKPKKTKNAKEPAAKKTPPSKATTANKKAINSTSKPSSLPKPSVGGLQKKKVEPASSSSGGRNGSMIAPPSISIAAVPSGPDITQGPPVTTGSAAKKLILQYMKQQNRPYSALQIMENLHKRISKATLERVLTAVSGEGEDLIAKEYGKTRLYYFDQSKVAMETSEDALEDLQSQLGVIKADAEEVMQQEKELSRQLQELRNEPTDDLLDEHIEKLSTELTGKKRKIEALILGHTSNTKRIDSHALQSAVKRYNQLRQAWIDRKSRCIDVLDSICESSNKKRKDLANDMGLELDTLTVVPPKMVVPT